MRLFWGRTARRRARRLDQVVVVEVGGLVQQLDVGKADGEEGGAGAPAAAGGDAEAQQGEGGKVGVHPPCRPGLDPGESGIGEVVGRRQVEGINPAVGEKAGDGGQSEEAEEDAKGGRGCAVHRV